MRVPAPRPPALFFGREPELARFASEIPAVRLAVVYGAGGVGKTAFALRATAELADRVGAELAYVRCRAGESAATLALAVLEHLGVGEPARRTRPVDALIAVGPLVLVVDDAHLADVTSISELAEYLVTRSDRLSVCITSRAVLPLSPAAVNHLIIKLAGLDDGAARSLWGALGALYGERSLPDVRQGGALAGGNPLLIKQAYGEVQPPDDPLGLDHLDAPARSVLAELCALRRPATRAALGAGGEAVDAALAELERRFLVEVHRADRDARSDVYGVHDVVREAVEASRWRPGAEAHARCIEHYRAASGADEAALVELIHHAARSGDDELTLELLAAEAGQLRRVPPGSTLLDRAIRDAADRIEARVALPLELRLLRARVRARQGEIVEAWRDLEEIEEHSTTLECDRAEVANMLGLVQRARDAARRVLEDASASPLTHVRALAVSVEAERALGDVPGVLRAVSIETEPLSAIGPFLEGVRAWLRAVTSIDCERYGDAAAELERARGVLSASFPIEAMPMMGSLERAVRALSGDESPPADEAGELFDDSAFFRSVARLLRAQEHLVRGRPRRARELADQTRSFGAELGSLPIASWATWVWADAACVLGDFESVALHVPATLAAVASAGHAPPRARLELALAEALHATGQEGRALELAERVECSAATFPRSGARARALLARIRGATGEAPAAVDQPAPDGCGAQESAWYAIERALARGDLDLAAAASAELEATSTRFGWMELASRASVARGESALRRGDGASARAHLERHRGRRVAEGYAATIVHAAAIGAALDRPAEGAMAAGEVLAKVGLDRAWARAAFDAIARRLHLAEPAALALTTHGGLLLLARAQLAELRLDAELVVDRERREVRTGGRTLDLSRRATLLDLLAVLASPPGTWITPADLAARGWGLDYHAIKHHSRLAMAVARLRDLLGANAVESGRDGYRLAGAATWAVLRPVEAAERGP